RPATGGRADPPSPAESRPGIRTDRSVRLAGAYPLQEPAGDDEAAGRGLGFVNVFNPDGVPHARVASSGQLNAPWGMALAPAGFGTFSNHLLVGNFGDGTINAYNLSPYHFAGQLRNSSGGVLKV